AGELTLRVHDEQVIFNIFKAMQHPNEVESCMRIDVIDSLIQDSIEEENSSNIEELLQAEIEEEHHEEASESLPTKPEKIIEDKP
ncbi:hypothetical protein PIB30_077532, partial [Stylosanthes scabra]|nr:hypothetical protein [Stylosanthes scabra]